uniref:Uncharacterized protein n=1 Tax=Anguilla anguilla TaxID=7936 RepID=A0A0E9QDS1_ANGAN
MPLDSGECRHPCFSSETSGVTSCFLSHRRLQLSLHREESEEDLSYAALIGIYGHQIHQQGTLDSN